MFLQKQANVGALRQGGVGHLASFDFGGQPAEPTKLIYRKADTDQWPQWVKQAAKLRRRKLHGHGHGHRGVHDALGHVCADGELD